MGVTREEKETQRGHIFNIKFKLPIVNDSIEYKNKQNKSKGYSLKDGKKSIKTKELKVNDGNRWNHVYVEGISKKKGNNIGVHPNSFNGDGVILLVHVFYFYLVIYDKTLIDTFLICFDIKLRDIIYL